MCADLASIFQLVQIAGETVPGTSVPANILLSSLNITPAVKVEVDTYKGTGFKYATIAALNKEWIEADLSGVINYEELPYLLSSVLETATPTGTTTKIWSFTPNTTGPDTVKTFTVEQGGGGRAHKFTNGLVNELTLTFARDGCELSGTMLGQALQDGITMTSTPTAAGLVPVMATQVSGKLAATQAGLTAAAPLTRLLSAEWRISDRFAPVWCLNGQSGWSAYVETEPTLEVTLLVEADTEGMAILPSMRTGGTQWLRLSAVGPVIGAGPGTYTLQIDQPFKISDVSEFRDEDGVFAIEFTGVGVHDTTWGKAVQIDVTNTLAGV